ncbi:MAG TPA: dTMP kinase [Bryobacteraceae bacterium]|nr:dTMP kinase [Bryobacteraceae bacterium]
MPRPYVESGMPDHRGLFISFEGTEGSGKSTQMRLLVSRLRDSGYAVVENQEPGATGIGRQIRRILLDPAHQEMTPMTELLLMFASRAQAVAEIIVPALQRGEIIVSDRFTDSTLAYQGEARGLGFDVVFAAQQLALGSLLPDLTLCVSLDLETALARAHVRNQRGAPGTSETRIDQQSLEFHRRVDAGYRKIADLDSGRFRMIDGTGEPGDVAKRIWAQVSPLLPQAAR